MLHKLPHDSTIFMASIKQEAYFQKVFCNTYSLLVTSSTPSLQTNWTYCTQQREEKYLLLQTNFNLYSTCQTTLPYLDQQNAQYVLWCERNYIDNLAYQAEEATRKGNLKELFALPGCCQRGRCKEIDQLEPQIVPSWQILKNNCSAGRSISPKFWIPAWITK